LFLLGKERLAPLSVTSQHLIAECGPYPREACSYPELRPSCGDLLMEASEARAQEPARFPYRPSLKPHPFIGLHQFDTGSVRYEAGRGSFSLARCRPYMGPGRLFSGNPRPTPVRGPAALIPCTGPRLLPPIFNGDPSGVWVGRGLEQA